MSGNTAEQPLSGLEASTTYTVTISSILGNQESLPTTTTFTTTTNARGQQGAPSVSYKSVLRRRLNCNISVLHCDGRYFQRALLFPGHEVDDGDGLRDFKASDVTPRTALLSWMPPSSPTPRSYRLTYQTEGQELKVGRSVRIHSIVTAVKTWSKITLFPLGTKVLLRSLVRKEGLRKKF